jgi:AsmA family protein
MVRRRALVLLVLLGIPALLIMAVAALWGPDLLIPLVESRAKAVLGRPVTIAHLHVMPGRFLQITADDVVIGNPPDWQGEPFARIPRLTLEADLWAYVRHRQVIIRQVALDRPLILATQTATGDANYRLHFAHRVKIDAVHIDAGRARIRLAKPQVDVEMDISTRADGQEAQLVVDAKGTYGAQSISGRMVGGALHSLHEPAHPWPIDLKLRHRDTTASVVGTLSGPMAMKGGALTVHLAGPDLSSLSALTGLPIANRARFELSGQLDFADQRVQIRDLNGRLGNSDLTGNIDVEYGNGRPDAHAELASRRIDLADFGVGAGPGGDAGNDASPPRRAEVKGQAGDRLLPTSPVSSPRLHSADVHLRYRGQSVQSGSILLDNLDMVLDIVNGQVTLHPVSLDVGRGSIKANVVLTPHEEAAHTKAAIELQRVDIARLLAASPRFKGAGSVSGTGNFEATGRSLAQMLGNANGGMQLGMVGGDVSALLVHLAGLEFGKALLSALGFPQRTPVECFIGDMPLRHGVLTLKTVVLDTKESIINGTGTVDLNQEKLDLQLRTEAKHFSIGSLPAPIHITGTLKHPNVSAGSEMVARGGLAAGLAAAFPPLALLPTIQFGTGEDHRCDALLARAKQQPGGQRLPPSHNQQPMR